MATEFISNSWLMPTNANAEANRVSNYSLDFDGSSEKITLSTAINTGNNYSVSFWLNPDNVASGNSYIFSDSTTSPFKGLALDQGSYTAGGPGNFYYYSGSVVVPNTTAIPLGSWSHIVITFDVTGQEIKFYINGSLDKTTTSVANIGTLIDEFGTRIAGNYFNGKLTEISIFDYIVSASQVLELYGTGSAIGNPMAITNGRKPVAYYPLSNAAFNSEFLVPNGAEQDFVFDFLAAPTYSRISLGTSDFIGNKSISFWLNKNVNNGSVFAFGNTNYYPNVQSTTLQLNNGSTTVLSTGTINLNEWNHYVITGDGTTAKCYVNGVYKSTGIDRDISSAANWIGGQNNGTGMLNGKLSNIQKWDVVLSDGGVSIGDVASGDISTLYNYGTPYTGTQPQAANLQAWWKLDASATFDGSNWSIPDASSNSNTGTSSGMTAANLILSDLIINQSYDPFSLSFDGSNDYIDCGNDSIFNNTFTGNAFSFSVWIKSSSNVSYDGILNFGSRVQSFLQGNKIIMWLQGSSGYVVTAFTSNTTILNDTWYHIVFTRNGNDNTLYINGVSDNTVTSSGNVATTTSTFKIGTYDGSQYFWDGNFSNISIYNSSLTSAQVTTLYNEGKPFDLNTFAVTPVSWWRLGATNSSFDGTNWTVLDEIGTSNGTSANMTQADLVDGVGATGSGTSSGMSSGTNRTGDAPYSDNNAVSYNMSVTAKSTSVPT